MKVNSEIDVPGLQRIMKDFLMESEKLGLTVTAGVFGFHAATRFFGLFACPMSPALT